MPNTNLKWFHYLGLCLLAKSFLRLIPVPVLYGLLLQFGVVSFSGTQLYNRILFLFIPLKNTPNWSYARGLRVNKRNLFTLLQIACVGILLFFKYVAVVSFFFPIFLVLLVCLRKFVLPSFYTDSELEQVMLKLACFFLYNLIPLIVIFSAWRRRRANWWPRCAWLLWACTFAFISRLSGNPSRRMKGFLN